MHAAMPFGRFVVVYLDDVELSHRSHHIKKSVLKNWATHFGEAKPLNAIAPLDVRTYVRQRQQLGRKVATINHEVGILGAALTHARRRWGLPIGNPTEAQRLPGQTVRLRYLERHEAEKLLQAAESKKPILADFVKLALNTGCRKNELMHLRWQDVDMKRSYIDVRPEITKTRKRRILPMNRGAKEVLQRIKVRQERDEVRTVWVFANQAGERLVKFDELFRKALKLAGIVDFRIHDLRHTFASWLVSEGVDLIKVRDLLGHSSITMTERYAHLMPNKLHDAVAVLDEHYLL